MTVACVRVLDAEADVLNAAANDDAMFDVVEDGVFPAKKEWSSLA